MIFNLAIFLNYNKGEIDDLRKSDLVAKGFEMSRPSGDGNFGRMQLDLRLGKGAMLNTFMFTNSDPPTPFLRASAIRHLRTWSFACLLHSKLPFCLLVIFGCVHTVLYSSATSSALGLETSKIPDCD